MSYKLAHAVGEYMLEYSRKNQNKLLIKIHNSGKQEGIVFSHTYFFRKCRIKKIRY